MQKYLTIPPGPPEEEGMNFNLLREQGLKFIEKLSGHAWTNYNTPDPGITILEQICYAITELCYRLSFDIRDLVADSGDDAASTQFFTAREILPVNPLTMDDFRKILIDVDGVKNAWLEKAEYVKPEIYYKPDKKILAFEGSHDDVPLTLNGLYRVFIEKEREEQPDDDIIQAVKERLHSHRNLCEDFEEIKILPKETITVESQIHIKEDCDPDQCMVHLYMKLKEFISPSVRFYSLEEILEKGASVEKIFTGPVLNNGFIDDEELRQADKKVELYVSDLIRIILDIPGVKTVGDVVVSRSQSKEAEQWVLKFDSGHMPRLADIESLMENIKFYKKENNIECVINKDKVLSNIKGPKVTGGKKTNGINDIPIPRGDYKELADYEPMQNLFPENYGIGRNGLPESANSERKAQAKQLRAYLTVYDQLLSNYFKQLSMTKELFSFDFDESRTYFRGRLEGIKEDIFDEEYERGNSESPERATERRNRFLNHLAARFGEKFPDHSLMQYNRNESKQKRVQSLASFLKNYPEISATRGTAFNCIDNNGNKATGLKKRLCMLLDIDDSGCSNLADSGKEGFHMVEHILMRPRFVDNPGKMNGFLPHAFDDDPDPYSFKISFIFPENAGRFKEVAFKQFVRLTLDAEVPAHIAFSVYFLGKEKMGLFEKLYEGWLNTYRGDNPPQNNINIGFILDPETQTVK